ncbi:MAG: hypothetical protein ABIN21_03765 [candidate division WOR-3 bacterium]
MIYKLDLFFSDIKYTIFLSKKAMCDEYIPYMNHCEKHKNMESDFMSKFRTRK